MVEEILRHPQDTPRLTVVRLSRFVAKICSVVDKAVLERPQTAHRKDLFQHHRDRIADKPVVLHERLSAVCAVLADSHVVVQIDRIPAAHDGRVEL